MTKCHPISNEVTPSFLTLTFSPEKSNGDLGLSLKQILLSSGWRGISINHLIIKSQKFNSINIKYDCKCLKVWFIYCYLYHVRFHHPQRTNAVLSCIFISHCCDFEISNASKYDILKCLQVFHFAWQPACTSRVLCSCEVTSGEPPASQEKCGLKENLSLPVYFSLSLFCPFETK